MEESSIMLRSGLRLVEAFPLFSPVLYEVCVRDRERGGKQKRGRERERERYIYIYIWPASAPSAAHIFSKNGIFAQVL